MDQTQPSAIAFNYSRFAQRVARRDASLYERVVASIDERPPLTVWRRELAAADAAAIDDTLRRYGDVPAVAALVAAAHEVCPYSKATRGNIDVAVSAKV